MSNNESFRRIAAAREKKERERQRLAAAAAVQLPPVIPQLIDIMNPLRQGKGGREFNMKTIGPRAIDYRPPRESREGRGRSVNKRTMIEAANRMRRKNTK